jgi:heptosyltransferase-2
MERFERILVVKLGDLGDLILTTPALRALREAQPAARIDLLAPPVAAGVLAGSDLIDRHLALPKSALEQAVRRGPLGLPALASFGLGLRRGRYDACVAFQHQTTRGGIAKLGAMMLASGAPRRFGLDDGRAPFLTDRLPDEGFGARHEAQNWLDVASMLGADRRVRPPELPIGPADRAVADELLADLPRPIVALHPGSGAYSTARRWAADRFAEVGRRLRGRRGASIVVVGNEPDANAPVAAATGGRDLGGRTTLRQLAAVLAQVDLLVSNDSGVLHVAAAAGAPIVAIYGLTDARAWGPYYGDAARQERAVVVDVGLPCRPCLYRGHELGWREGCATRDCLGMITTGMVLAAAERQLERFGPASSG